MRLFRPINFLLTCFILIILIILWGCTRVHYRPIQKILIATPTNVKIVSVSAENTSRRAIRRTKKLTEHRGRDKPARNFYEYVVYRDSKPLSMVIKADSLTKAIYITPHRNYASNLNLRYVFRAKDSLEPYNYKKWRYPRKNVITVNDTGLVVSRFEPAKKNAVYLALSPGIQGYNFIKDDGHYISGGFPGIEAGAEYFYHNNRFLSFNAGAATDIFPLAMDYFGTGYRENANIVYTTIRDNIVKGSFDIGYGVSFSRLYWNAIPFGDTLNLKTRRLRTTALGISFSLHWKIKQNFRVGILYQPVFVSVNHPAVTGYQHYLSFHCSFNFNLRPNK